jgi:hypothetical protein
MTNYFLLHDHRANEITEPEEFSTAEKDVFVIVVGNYRDGERLRTMQCA